MDDNRMNEAKDKVVGGVKEATGKVFGNEELELKGTLQKGLGKAREVAGDVADEMDGVKDTVVGSLKEVTGKYTDDEGLRLKGKFQKGKAKGKHTKTILKGAGVLAGAYLLTSLVRRGVRNADK